LPGSDFKKAREREKAASGEHEEKRQRKEKKTIRMPKERAQGAKEKDRRQDP